MSGVELTEVSVRYGSRIALAPLSLTVPSGQWFGVIGPNGAGKSSLLRAIAGLCQSSGTVRIGDAAVDKMSRRARARRVAYLPQEPVLPAEMEAIEYVLLGRTAHISYFGTESSHDRSIARAALDRLDLRGLARRRLGNLSGGERQRVVLARAIATGADVLLLDEPTTALDIGHGQQALELVDELRKNDGLTVMAAMHDLGWASLYCERLALLNAGRLSIVGPPDEVLTEVAIATVYGAEVVVGSLDGAVTVTPRRPKNSAAPTR